MRLGLNFLSSIGVCYCIVCNQTLTYGSSGKKCLMDHSNNASHLIAFSSARNSYQIPGAISKSDISRKKSPFSDRVLDNRVIVGSFLAEHCLPYSLSQPIIDLCKKLAQDTEALNITSMGRTAATYTMTYGIAEAMKKELSQCLQGNFFSLNIDKATNNAGNKCLNVLVRYYSDTKQQVCVELISSRGLLQEFSRYVKTFQSVKPQCHRLHPNMYEQFRTFLSGYIIPDKISDPKKGMKGLCNLNLADKSIQVRERQLGLGVYRLPLLKEFLRNKSENIWINDFFNAVRVGYQNAADKMKKMPLLNSTIIQLSALDPGLQQSTETATALTKLAEKLPNVICSDKCGMLDREIRLYTIDQALTQLDADETSPDFRLDTGWWSKAINMKEPSTDQVKYPLLGLLVKRLLSLFSGPLVESTFNIMDDIIECDESRMLHRNYEGIAIIKKCHLKSKGETSLTMSISQQMRNFVNSAKQLQQVFIKSKTYPTEKPQASSKLLSTPVSSSSSSSLL
ncbi:oxidoreductase YteT [Biomphalaria pfeifferi]|uniref:Oxidoreductase YteT n=1 Tax=Biomphalaria pfeifferi TaxID=112525 RepID=A0AAD8EW58_BIOPF|nr:oxidoreductase YteT [Biomphalaria pfeifferi]